MNLLIEVALWIGAGLLAAAVITPRWLAMGALAAVGSAVSFGAFARSATHAAWANGDLHVFGLVAAVSGALLGAVAVRALHDATEREPYSRR
jgi:hypothetical protein